MRILSYFMLLFLCLPGQQHTGMHHGHAQAALRESEFDWLLGDWQRMNDRPGRTTFEHWSRISGSEYQGLGYTLRNGDTIFKETMKLHVDKGAWIFEVSGVNEDPTPFLVTKKAPGSFTCENEKNEFPKYIEYSLVDNMLKARIYGAGQEVLFSFEKL
jgi:hypothetical protein